MADGLFAMFAVVFLATRNVLFSVYVVYPMPLFVQGPDGKSLDMTMLKNALWVLVCLHIYWASLVPFANVDFKDGIQSCGE